MLPTLLHTTHILYAVDVRKGSGVSCGPRFIVCWCGRVMTDRLNLISLTVNSHSIIYLWKPHSWTHKAIGGQITTTPTLLYHSHFKAMTAEYAANWDDTNKGPPTNVHNITGQSNINEVRLCLYVMCVCVWLGVCRIQNLCGLLQTAKSQRWIEPLSQIKNKMSHLKTYFSRKTPT